MSIKKELLKKMRDVLRGLEETHYDLYWDIQAELDLDEQKPVAWMSTKGDGGLTDDSYYANHKDYAPLYLAPQKREPAQTAREMYQRGYAKAKDDLKREQDVVIQELVLLLKKVLYGLAMGWPVSSPEGNKLYAEAADYLKRFLEKDK